MQRSNVFAAANAVDQGARRDPKLKRLIIRPGAIGDLIVSLPALESLRCEYTEVWAPSRNVPLVRFADRVRAIPSTGLDMVEFGGDARCLDGFDEIVSWYGASREEFRNAVAHLPFVFHTALAGANLHAIDFYLQQVGAAPGAVPRIDVPARKGDYIAIHPFSGSPRKNWPLEKFRQLAAALPGPVHFTAGPAEALEGAIRYDNLGDLAQWLAGARLYIGNDSGISHLAAAVGVPVIAIFRTTDPAIWAPRPSHVLVGDPTVCGAANLGCSRLSGGRSVAG